MVELGIMFRRENPPEDLPDFARQVEAVGFDELWVIEDCFYEGGISQSAIVLALTESIKVGLGIMPAVARNPAFTALEIATLARIFPNRFLPGIGHGVAEWMKQIGAFPKSQLGALEEYVAAIRAILHGESVSTQGNYVQLDAVQLEYPLDAVPPVQLGIRGPKSLEISGRVADGTILAEGCSPAYVQWIKQYIEPGRAAGNRTDKHRITAYIWWSMDADLAVARKRVRDRLAFDMVSMRKSVYQQALGIVDDVESLIAQGGEAYLSENMPDAWVNQMAVVGAVDECATTIQQLSEAGADSVILVPLMDNESALAAAGDVIQAVN